MYNSKSGIGSGRNNLSYLEIKQVLEVWGYYPVKKTHYYKTIFGKTRKKGTVFFFGMFKYILLDGNFKHLDVLSPAFTLLILSETEIHVLSQIFPIMKKGKFFSYIGATITKHLHQIIIHEKEANTLI